VVRSIFKAHKVYEYKLSLDSKELLGTQQLVINVDLGDTAPVMGIERNRYAYTLKLNAKFMWSLILGADTLPTVAP